MLHFEVTEEQLTAHLATHACKDVGYGCQRSQEERHAELSCELTKYSESVVSVETQKQKLKLLGSIYIIIL